MTAILHDHDKIEDLIEENKQLRKEIKFFCTILTASENSFAMSKTTTDRNISSLDHVRNQVTRLPKKDSEEILKLRTELDYLENHNKSLASQLQTMADQLESKKHTILMMESELLQILPQRLQIRDLENKKVSNAKVIETLTAECKKADQLKIQIASLEELVNQKATAIAELESLVFKYKSEAQGVREELSSNDERLGKLKATLNHVNSLLDRKTSRENELIAQNEALEGKLSSVLNEKIQLQFNFDIEIDKLKEEMLILQNKLQLRDEAMQLMTEQSRQARTVSQRRTSPGTNEGSNNDSSVMTVTNDSDDMDKCSTCNIFQIAFSRKAA